MVPGRGSSHGEGKEIGVQQLNLSFGTSGVALIQHKYPLSRWSLRPRGSTV